MPATLTDVYGSVVTNREPQIIGNKITGLKIFRAGSFADSEGVRRRYTQKDLDKMVENFNLLVEKGILPNVPVREDHTRSIASVVGYFSAVRREGNFLVADIDLTEPQAVQRYSNKTYRARSAEVGTYVDNDGTEYDPCILGVAFCDIPAVEGLYAAQIATYANGAAAPAVRKPTGSTGGQPAADPNWRFDPMTGEKLSPQDGDGNDGDALMKDVLLDLHNLKDLYAGDPDTESSLQQIVDALSSILQDSDASSDTANAGKNGRSPQAGPGNANHSGDTVALIQFSLGGHTVEVEDKHRESITAIQSVFAAVEKRATDAEAAVATVTAERDSLKGDIEKAEFAARDAKVDGWLKDGKIVPAQVEALKAFAKTLSPEQFAAQDALYTGSPVQTFAAGATTGAPGTHPDEDQAKAEKVKLARQGYRMLKTAGISGDKLTNSKFAKDLKALGADPEGE